MKDIFGIFIQHSSASASELLAHYNHFQIILFSSEESRQAEQESRVWPLTSIRFSYQQKTINTHRLMMEVTDENSQSAGVLSVTRRSLREIFSPPLLRAHKSIFRGELGFIVSEINLLGQGWRAGAWSILTAEC